MNDPNNPCVFCPSGLDVDRVAVEGKTYRVLWSKFEVCLGHALIVPRRHVASFFDLTYEEVSEFMTEGVQTAWHCVRDLYAMHGKPKPTDFNLGVNIGPAAGQTVMHCHIHLFPRVPGDVPDPRGGVRNIFPNGNYLKAPVIPGFSHQTIPSGLQCLRQGGVVTTSGRRDVPQGARVLVVNLDDDKDTVVATASRNGMGDLELRLAPDQTRGPSRSAPLVDAVRKYFTAHDHLHGPGNVERFGPCSYDTTGRPDPTPEQDAARALAYARLQQASWAMRATAMDPEFKEEPLTKLVEELSAAEHAHHLDVSDENLDRLMKAEAALREAVR